MVLVNVDLPKAVSDGSLDTVNELIANGHPLNELDSYGRLPLTEAAKSRLGYQPKLQEEIVKLLLISGANINARDGYGRSALTNAALEGCPKIIPLLISSGADVNQEGEYGGSFSTALSCAVSGKTKKHLQVVEQLLAAGADPNYKFGFERSFSVLMEASRSSSPEIIAALIKAGAEVDHAGAAGSAMTIAIEKNRPDNVEALRQNGANLDLVIPADKIGSEAAGKSALEFAKAKKNKKVLAALGIS